MCGIIFDFFFLILKDGIDTGEYFVFGLGVVNGNGAKPAIATILLWMPEVLSSASRLR